jgi:hypothetical protein
MFEKYMVCEHSLQNVSESGKLTGFQFKARLPYYRGLGISMIENLAITVDEQKYPRQAIRVTLHGNTYTQDEMEQEYADRWEFGEEGMITVLKPGGLTSGPHKIEMEDTIRVSYLPFLLIGSGSKVVELSA